MSHALRFATLAFGLSILLCADAANAQHQIRLRDDKGQPVKNAEVIIDCNGNKREGMADAGGTFSWGRMNGPIQCALIIASASTETHAGVLDIPAMGIINSVIVLTRKNVWVLQVTVIDEEKKSPVVGVEVKFECGSNTFFRTTNGSGLAEIDKFTALYGLEKCSITTDHNLYEPYATTVAIPKRPIEPTNHSVAIKRKINVKTVQVTVVDSDTDKPIQDARVRLTGSFFKSFSGTTGASGVADIEIDRAGSFQIEVAQDNYYPDKSTRILVESGAGGESLTATVSLARKKNQSGTPLAVTVKGKRLDGTIVTLKNAKVTVEGSDEIITDSNGMVTARLPGFSGDSVNVLAAANGYEPQTKSFSVPRFSAAIIAPELTFILTEKKPEITGVNLLIEVTDRKDGRPVAGATVALAGKAGTSNAITDVRGYVQFRITGDAIKYEQYLRYTVKKEGYVEKWSDVSADLLKPSDEPRYYSIQIEKPVENKDSVFWGTWNGTGNAKGITMTLNSDYTMTFSDTRPAYARSVQGKWSLGSPGSIDVADWRFYYRDGKLVDLWGNIYNK